MNLSPGNSNLYRVIALFAAVATGALAGCGGGGGDDSPIAAAPPPPAAAALTITGTAATGAAISGGTVDAKCAVGAASGTTLSDGSYSLNISGGSFPCMLRVTAGGTVLHSVAVGSGAAFVTNITPVTQLIVANLVGLDPAAYYASFSSSAAAAITLASVNSAQAVIVAILRAAGIDLTSLGDLISAALQARTATTAGNAYDQALDSLASAFTSSGSTLATLTSAVVTRATGAANPSPTASLPAELLLRPAAATCAALRSGTYRMVTPTPNATLAAQFGTATINATTLAVTRPDGSTGTWAANGACRFTDQGAPYIADIIVTQAGLLFARQSRDNGATYRNVIGFPEQSHSLAELAGSWNAMGMASVANAFVGFAGSSTWSSAGVLSAASNCQNNATWALDVCTAVPQSTLDLLAPVVVNSAGGYDLADAATHNVSARMFAYRAGGGGLILVSVGNTGAFSFFAPQATVALPAVGTVGTNWNLDMFGTLASAGATYETTNTINSIDTTAGSWTRTQRTLGASYSYLTTLFANSPRSGYVHRPAAIVTASDGTTQVRLNEFTFLRLPGMGMSPVIIPSSAGNVFEFSAAQP